MSLIERMSLAELRVVWVTAGQCLEPASKHFVPPTFFYAVRPWPCNIMTPTVPFKHCFINWLLSHCTVYADRCKVHSASHLQIIAKHSPSKLVSLLLQGYCTQQFVWRKRVELRLVYEVPVVITFWLYRTAKWRSTVLSGGLKVACTGRNV
jgi:uncharacterized protein (DUF2249 family)